MILAGRLKIKNTRNFENTYLTVVNDQKSENDVEVYKINEAAIP